MKGELKKNRILFEKTFISLLEKGREVELPVFGLSMFPFMLPEDKVKISKIALKELKTGDVIVFKGDVRLVLHRLIKIDLLKGIFVSKGDGLIRPDKVGDVSEILGVAKEHYRNGRKLRCRNSRFMKSLLVVLTPVTGYFNFYLGLVWDKYFKSR